MTWHLKSFTAEGPSYIPGQGTKIPQEAVQHGQKKKKEKKKSEGSLFLS